MTTRRDFLARAGVAAGAFALDPSPALARGLISGPPLAERVRKALGEAPAAAKALAEDEAFWAKVREGFDLHPGILNLDHGWTNPAPRAAVDLLVEGARDLESLPADRLPRLWEEVTSTKVRAAVAKAMGVPPGEIALVRNATEALDTVILGLPLRAGDEIVCSAHDYYAMLDALDQRRRRDGVVLRMVRPGIPASSLDVLAEAYEAAIGPRTRLVLLTHPSNLTGQILPARRIAEAAHRAGAEVAVDGAQSLGVLDDPVRALDCDYYGASMHKWLGAPVGMGALWMRPAHVAKVWPLVASPAWVEGMGRFEWIGTAPEYINPAVLPALEVHEALGPVRKAERLRYLARHLRMRVRSAIPDARFYTTDDPAMSLGLTTIDLPGRDPKELQTRLLAEHRILVQAMVGIRSAPEIRGLRVSPNVYSTPAELDRFVEALAREAR